MGTVALLIRTGLFFEVVQQFVIIECICFWLFVGGRRIRTLNVFFLLAILVFKQLHQNIHLIIQFLQLNPYLGLDYHLSDEFYHLAYETVLQTQ